MRGILQHLFRILIMLTPKTMVTSNSRQGNKRIASRLQRVCQQVGFGLNNQANKKLAV